MIPIPSLLFFEECEPPTTREEEEEEEEEKKKAGDIHQNGQYSTKEIQPKRRMNINRRRQQQQHSPSTASRQSQSSVHPIRLRKVIEIEPRRRRYDYDGFTNPRTRFWELQQQEERQQQSQHNTNTNNNNQGGGRRQPNTKLVISIRRKSQLCIFLLTLISFIIVDEWSLLPAGTILYIVALSIAWENWMNELEQDQLFIKQLQNQRNKRNKLQYEIDKAKFEYHILKNKPNIDIKVIINKNKRQQQQQQEQEQEQQQLTYDDNNNNNNFDTKWIIYADERR
jgi:hypothetical protein